MTRQRKSPVLETAQRRINGLKYLNPNLDLGKGLSLEQFATLADELDAKLTDYNDTVASLDSKRSDIAALEERLRKLSERMLTTGNRFKFNCCISSSKEIFRSFANWINLSKRVF